MPSPAEYMKVPVSDFDLSDNSNRLGIDIFHEVSPKKIQKFGQKGSDYLIDVISKALKNNMQWFLIKKEDYRTHVGFLIAPGTQNITSPSDFSKKHSLLKIKTETLLNELIQNGLSSKNRDLALNTVSNALYFIIENSNTAKLFEKIEAHEHNNLHSLAVAILSQMVAIQTGWTGESTSFRVVLSALLHDVGLNENIDQLLKVSHDELNETELRVVVSHTTRGRDILKSISGMPSEVIMTAYQHHEFVNGTGYPSKLMLDEIHPFARLISLTNRFYEIYTLHRDSQCTLFEIFQILKKEDSLYDLRFLKSLEEIIAKPKK